MLVAPLEPFAVSSQNHHVPPQVEYFAVLVDSLLDLVDVNNAGTLKKVSDFAVEHVEKPKPAGPEESVVVDLDVWVFLEHWFWVVESVRGTRSYRLHSRVIDDSNPQKGVTSVDVTPFCGEESTKGVASVDVTCLFVAFSSDVEMVSSDSAVVIFARTWAAEEEAVWVCPSRHKTNSL